MNMTRHMVEDVSPWVKATTNELALVTVLDSFDLWVDKDDKSLTPSLMFHGFWESWITTWCYNNITDGMCILDVGANCGYYTMLFEKLVGGFGHVIAYEANPEYARMLYKTRGENSANFTVVGKALSNKEGRTALHIPSDLNGSASIVADWEDSETYHDVSVEVLTTTLDAEAAKGIFWRPDIIKMDVEGAEELVWDGGGLVLADGPMVLMEYTPGAYSEGFNKKLFEYGTVTRINEQGGESPVDDAHLKGLTDWDMLVLRSKYGPQ